MKLMDLKKGVGQYLGEDDGGSSAHFKPFADIVVRRGDTDLFRECVPRVRQRTRRMPRMEAAIKAAQPDLLFTAAKSLDNFLNNQSLVVLFTFNGKKLLFAGDAQGGNWEYWMFGGTPEKSPSADQIEKGSKAILANLDFLQDGPSRQHERDPGQRRGGNGRQLRDDVLDTGRQLRHRGQPERSAPRPTARRAGERSARSSAATRSR